MSKLSFLFCLQIFNTKLNKKFSIKQFKKINSIYIKIFLCIFQYIRVDLSIHLLVSDIY